MPARDQELDEPQRFETQRDWDGWLKKHHAKSAGVWLRIAKKGAELPSITHGEAVEVALCWGWIDSRAQSEGPHYWKQRFTPRGARSIWSKVNRAKALALIDAGRMQPTGLKEVERAKADGRWDRAYDSSSTASVPAELEGALDANPRARAFFETLNSTNRYAVLWRVQTAKRQETKLRRIEQLVEMLARHEKLHP